ncbi:hypothetical protein M8C21_000549, partial [Ambrosia artemisiifolia]
TWRPMKGSFDFSKVADQLDPIIALVSSWQKREFESWPALLDEVQARFDTNAGQLWFPLYSVLQPGASVDTNDCSDTTTDLPYKDDSCRDMQRHVYTFLEEFILTSSIGEFKRRLQLVYAFHGHISTLISQNSSFSQRDENNVKILYNTFGYYVQFLPIILEQSASNRKNIEGELKEVLKLCKWERNEWYMTMEASKRTRGKFEKLIQKYTDMLKQPVRPIVDQAVTKSGLRTIAVKDRTLFSNSFEKCKQVLDVAFHETHFQNKRRFIKLSAWKNKADLALEDMRVTYSRESDHTCVHPEEAKGNIDTVSKFIDFQSSSGVTKKEWDQIQHTFEQISTNLIGCGELWKDDKKSLGNLKRRSLPDLQKLLDNCGLSKNRYACTEDQSMEDKFLQPSYIMEHLLLKEGRLSSDVAALKKAQNPPIDNPGTVWNTSNEYFFKSISSLDHLQHVRSNFHKDFTKQQVDWSVSYIRHLVEIQKSHRAAAYDLAKGLELLKKRSLPLHNLFLSGSGVCFSQNQVIVSKCMWRQKQLFDAICNIINDECLLLKSVENNHLSNCQSVGTAASRLHLFLEKFAPEFKKSKVLFFFVNFYS